MTTPSPESNNIEYFAGDPSYKDKPAGKFTMSGPESNKELEQLSRLIIENRDEDGTISVASQKSLLMDILALIAAQTPLRNEKELDSRYPPHKNPVTDDILEIIDTERSRYKVALGVTQYIAAHDLALRDKVLEAIGLHESMVDYRKADPSKLQTRNAFRTQLRADVMSVFGGK